MRLHKNYKNEGRESELVKFFGNYTNIVAIIERSAGNESVGTMWVETKTFDKKTKVEDIIKWADCNNCDGKLLITIDEANAEDNW